MLEKLPPARFMQLLLKDSIQLRKCNYAKRNIRESAGIEMSYRVIDRKTWKSDRYCQIFQNSLES